MSEPGATGRSDPFLPSEPAYWEGLKHRIVAAGMDTVDGYGSVDRSLIMIGPRATAVLAVCSTLAALAMWAFPPRPEAFVDEPPPTVSRALLPDDPMAAVLLLDSPPSLAVWLGGRESR